jgi:hypothetical protein
MAETKIIETFKQRPTSWTFNREPLLLVATVEVVDDLTVDDGLTVTWDGELVDAGVVVVGNTDTCRTFFVAKPTPVVIEPLADTSAKSCLKNT